MTSGAIKALLALLLGLGTLSPAGSVPRSKGLLPLSLRDMNSSKETGCTYSLDVGRRTYIQAIGHELMVRTAGGLKICKIDDAGFQALVDGIKTAPACGGYRLSIKRIGRVDQNEASDSASWPAIMTAVQGRRTVQKLHGLAGVAC